MGSFKDVLSHYQNFFEGHDQEILSWKEGPVEKTISGFKIFRAAPGPRHKLWTYASIGASSVSHDNGGVIEFAIISPVQSDRCAELLAMAAFFHSSFGLDIGHTVELGEPWMPGSNCDHCLISVLYPFDPALGICRQEAGPVSISWLLPITEKERKFKMDKGLEALELLFEEKQLEYWEINRPSLI